MTDITGNQGLVIAQSHQRELGLKKRYASERRFRAAGVVAIALGVLFLIVLFWSIISKGYTAFQQTKIHLDVYLEESIIDPKGNRSRSELTQMIRYNKVLRPALYKAAGVDEKDKSQKALVKATRDLLSAGAAVELRDLVSANPDLIGKRVDMWFIADGDVDSFVKGQISRETPEARRQISDAQIAIIDNLLEKGVMAKKFNSGLFTYGASSRPETAGIGVAALGSIFMMLIVLVCALPIGVAASIYLEEFAPKNRWTDLIEVNINNLAAVPSIVFGLLGLAVFINFAGLPRSASVVGGSGVDSDDPADDHHCHPLRPQSRAAVHS